MSHVESGRHKPTGDFARRAEETLNAGKALGKRWLDYETAKNRAAPAAAPPAPRRPEQPYATGSAIIVAHDGIRLNFDGSPTRADHPLPDPYQRRPLPR
ncbi:hypothetical protein [Streptomyces sp. NPDC047046]|uniref:hypothetical protein n=1 Tax=Streptomyces sp. NPDC047046 TaxID=3155378 RepID=UPI0033F69DAB